MYLDKGINNFTPWVNIKKRDFSMPCSSEQIFSILSGKNNKTHLGLYHQKKIIEMLLYYLERVDKINNIVEIKNILIIVEKNHEFYKKNYDSLNSVTPDKTPYSNDDMNRYFELLINKVKIKIIDLSIEELSTMLFKIAYRKPIKSINDNEELEITEYILNLWEILRLNDLNYIKTISKKLFKIRYIFEDLKIDDTEIRRLIYLINGHIKGFEIKPK